MEVGKPLLFFAKPSHLRKWFVKNHDRAKELWVGYYRKDSGRPSITWPESVDEALCFGWIDGIRKKVDEVSYAVRFTPRRSSSIWSAINVARVATLSAEGRMQPAGRAVFEQRSAHNARGYSLSDRVGTKFNAAHERVFRRNQTAWTFFKAQPPGYQRNATCWVESAKRPETHTKRLAQLIRESHLGRRI